jgi:excisionase family DNA binding protein
MGPSMLPNSDNNSPWLTADEAAARARVGVKTIYAATRAGKLRHAKIGGRRELRFRDSWIDQWLEDTSEPIEQMPLRAVATRIGR